jgi:hypothetical protein
LIASSKDENEGKSFQWGFVNALYIILGSMDEKTLRQQKTVRLDSFLLKFIEIKMK